MKNIINQLLAGILIFPKYIKENGYFQTLKFVYITEGRIGRLHYLSCIITPIIATIISIVLLAIVYSACFEITNMIKSETTDLLIGISYLLVILILYIPFSLSIFTLTTRRFHDFGYSGWWQLCNLCLPIFFFFITLLICIFDKGEPEKNKYGPIPKKQ